MKALRAFNTMMQPNLALAPRSESELEQQELRRVRGLMAHAKRARTLVKNCAAWMRFVLWCSERTGLGGEVWVTPLPAEPVICARYVAFLVFGGVWLSTGRVQQPLRPSTVAGYCVAPVAPRPEPSQHWPRV